MRLWTLNALIIVAVTIAGLLVARLPSTGKMPTPGARKACAAIGYNPNEIDRAVCAELNTEK